MFLSKNQKQDLFLFVTIVIYYQVISSILLPWKFPLQVSGANALAQSATDFQLGLPTQAPNSPATVATFSIPHQSHPQQLNHGSSIPHISSTTTQQPLFSSSHHHRSQAQGRQVPQSVAYIPATPTSTTAAPQPTIPIPIAQPTQYASTASQPPNIASPSSPLPTTRSPTTTPLPIYTTEPKASHIPGALQPSQGGIQSSRSTAQETVTSSTQEPPVATSTTTTTTSPVIDSMQVNSMNSMSNFNHVMGVSTSPPPELSYEYTSQPPSNGFGDSISYPTNNDHLDSSLLERQGLESQESNLQSPTANNLQVPPLATTFTHVDLQAAPNSESKDHKISPPPVPINALNNQMTDPNDRAKPTVSNSSLFDSSPVINSSISNSSEVFNANQPITLESQLKSSNRSLDDGMSEARTFGSQAKNESSSLSISTLTSASSSNPTNTSLPKVQMLKPKLKFKCNRSEDCKNGALCHNGICFCLPGYTGESCETNIDECRQFTDGQPCLNGGTCVDDINNFRCECPPGYRGDRCQDVADMCSDSPCLNDATCINHKTSYTCKCKPGWEGQHCEIDIDDCSKNPCQNNATCIDSINIYRCECAPGFEGPNCETNINDCANNPCQNKATCKDLNNDYECECLPGYSGKNCEEDIDDCYGNPCKHGECTDLVNGFQCICHDGYTGTRCDHDINECNSARPVCLNGGTCENIEASYKCLCRDGWTGRNCTEISDYCKAKRPCGKFGTCKNTNIPKSPFSCECQSGYLGNKCERKRDCQNECHSHHAHCVSNITCACLPGRREERIMCEYVASCEQVQGELCLNGGTCKNLDIGGYQCLCQEPFYGPICQFMAERQFDAILLVIITCVGFLLAACAVVSLLVFRSVRKARATRGTYSPSTQEKFGNSASDLLKPPIPERLI